MSLAFGGSESQVGDVAHSFQRPAAQVRPGFKRLVLIYLWVAIVSGCIVYVEPSPYDVLLLGAMVALPVAGLVAFPRGLSVYLLLACGIVAGGYVASTQAGTFAVPVKHVTITLYLVLSSFVIAGFVAKDPARHTRLIMSAYVTAALIASVAALIGYFNLVPAFQDFLTEFGRARGTFKDPNVLGAFLAPAVLYALNGMLNGRAARALLWSAVLMVLLLATLLSFSRGACLNIAVGLLAFGFFAFVMSESNRKRVKLLVLAVLAGLVAVGALVALATVPAVSDLLGERASLEQSYDVGPEGRFGSAGRSICCSC